MNMTVRHVAPASATPILAAPVLPLKRPQPNFVKARAMPAIANAFARLVPPLMMLALLLIVWQLLCSKPGATLPSPTRIWKEAYDLIVDPCFVAGPQDVGLGWRVLTSLQRVVVGYGLAGLVGIL